MDCTFSSFILTFSNIVCLLQKRFSSKMDGMSSETNEENDNTEKPVRRRHSSILKPPRSPLRDLRDGNEIIQEPNASRNKKSSRRVSFADTIKVFQTESHMKIVRKSEIAETEARENVLFIQNKNSEDNYCEITGMNTLLCAPIQTKMQQREISVIEHDHEKKHSHDQTVIFSDENQMDLTASHTVMITKGLLDSTKSEKSTKIDTTLFLANLKLHSEDSRMKKELNFSMDQNTNSEKKINFSDFIKRLKTGKSNASSTGPDKENSEISIHSKESNRASSIHQMHASLNVDENSSNVTKIFREQDDGMNFTQCHTANIQSLVPTSSEANLREFKSDDITVYGNDLMDLTINRTIQILPSADNLSEIENQTQTVMIDVTTGCRTKTPGKKTVFENKPNAAFPDHSLNPKGEIHITRGHITGTETHTVTQTSNQDVRTLAMIPEPICSSPEIQGYKTFLYSSCNDAMELTKCLSSMKEEKNLLEHDCNYAKMYHNSDANSLLIGKTIYSGEDSMDFTKSHTVAIDNQNFKEDQTNVQITAIPIFEKEVMFQNHLTVSKDEEMNVNCSSVPYVSKEGLQQDQANPLSISLTGKKTVIFTGEENDLTKSHTTNLGSQAPLASYNLASEDASKSHCDSKSLLNEWEKMTKSHNELSQQPKIKSKNILTDTWGKEINQVLKISPYLDKVSYQSVDVNQDKATSYNIVYSGGDLNKQVALGKNRNTVSCEQSLFPTTRLFSSEGQSAMENHNIAVNSHIVKSIPSQNSKLPESLRESLGNPTFDCSRDKTIICSEEEQNMDLTKSHTVVIGCGPSEVQELGKTNLEHTNSQLINRQVAVKVEKCNKTPIEKTGVFIFNGMDVLEDRSIQKPGFLNEKQDVKICGRKSIDGLKIDKTVIFSEGNENDMDITKGYTLEINHKPLLDEHDSHLVPLAGTSKTVLYTCGQDDMEVTKSHTTAIECETVSPDEIITRPVDKTVIFIDNHDELEMTKSHTVFIDYQAKERTVLLDRPDFELSKRKSLGKPKVTSAEKNVFFPENGENDHSAAKVSRLTVLEEQSNSGPKEKAVAFIADENMEVSASTIWKSDKDIQKPAFLNEPLSGKSQRRKSLRLKNGKPIAFSSNDKNDTIQSCTVEMNNKSALEDREDTCLMSLAGTSKTVLYTCGQDDMEVTRSHTTAIECETVSPDEIITRPVDKTVMFIDNHDELEMTKSHTVFIDYQAKERTMLPDRPDFELSKRKSLGKPKVTSAEESVFFPENGESYHSAAKVSQLIVLGEQSNSGPKEKAVAFIADENMEVSTSTIWKSDKDIQKPAFLNEPLSGKSQRRKSLRLKNGKPIAFSSNDKNDTIQSCTVEMNNKSALEDREDTCLMSLAGTSKTVLYTGGQDDMEITRSHTTALECKAVSPVKITTGLMDNTVMFIHNHSDQEVTKSHTAVTECQATEKILQECPKFGTAKRKTLGVSFPKDGSSVQEITKKQAQAVENKIVLHTEQKHHVIPYSNTLSGDQGEIGIIKFHNTAVDEKVMAKVVDQAYTLEKAKLESCHLNSTERRNVDFTNSHAPAICGSSNNYSCLPNAISSFDNLEGNVMSLCDKNEKASNCPVQNDLAYANDLASEYCLKSEGLLLTTPCSLLEKEKVTQTNTKGHLDDYVITVLKDQDLIKEPQSLLANQTLIHGQDLGNITKLDSKEVSFTLPEDHMEDFVHNAEHSLKQTFVDDVYIGSQPHFSTHLPPLSQQGQSIVNKDEAILSKAGNKNLNTVIRNSSVPTYENESKMLNNEKKFTVACEKELKKNIQTAKCNIAIDFHSNSELAKQVIQTHANPKEASDPVIASNASSFSSGKPNLNNLNGKTEEFSDFLTAHIPPFPEQLLELVNKADSDMSVVQATEINNNTVSNSVKDDRDEENTFFHNRAETNSVPLMTVVNDKVRRCSLGIFLPRLPKRNCSVTGIDDLEQIPSDTTDLNHLETQPVSSKDSGIGFIGAKLNLSPSQYINEEDLPIYPGEINSSDSISIETEEKALIETYQKEISPSENKMKEICNSQKRTWVQEEDDDTQNEKKIRKSEIKFSDTAQDQQIFDHHAEGDIDKNANSVLMKSLGRTPSSCSSSLDSIKADGTSLDFSTYRNSQMESQLLTDTVCEESLKEKLKDGRITVKEFFILLQVHILIQKPRQSTLPAKFTINTQPTPEDLMLSQYVYRPKIQIYREDCEALRQKIEELKLSALNQDKLLTDVNRNLWEKMRHCSDEELKTFGIYLNKIKSHFTKMTKVFTHQGKVALYSKLVQSAQNEREKLQIRIDEMDNLLKKIANCLTELKIETKSLEDEKKDYHMEEWGSGMRTAEKELEQLKTEEEKLQRNLLELEVQKKQTLAQIDFVQKQTNTTEELLDQLSLSEWDVIEWSDDQAVFTFLYDTIELTITFGEPIVGLPFLNKAYRRIVDLNFQSLLDEDKAPPSSILVHKLIFQYIEEQESWKKKCITQHQVSKMLQEISLVVSHCRLLGEEIEFLKRWGPNYNLMNIDVNNTELRLLFSSSAAFAKFEITLYLSAHYPSVLLPFSIKNHLGDISQDEISALLSKVPLEDNYLKNVVKQIYQDLLQGCDFYQ
ncbi:PREDICTED: protein CASC5 isoform X2 [Miniopterus natalensis]|uniref:protein CASC5 isoform X2 n=1 Tax=Miniopterus natalensis TaxID=291302 RepID=UPI0007A6BE45|nr:PREDICTED: protein CASC5 isoform X2 [Miniopterus natalensis]